MRIVFCGTPEFALPSLQALVDAGHQVAAVFCQPSRPVGRKQEMIDPPVKTLANHMGIPAYQFADIRSEESVNMLRALAPDLMVTAAFGQILSEEDLNIPRMGTINVHGSLLPQYRGASPIQCAVIDGLRQTGVSIIYTVLALDAGDILLQKTLSIDPNETAGELFPRMAALGAEALLETIAGLEAGTIQAQPQNEAHISTCKMLRKEDGNLRWENTAKNLHDCIRGLNPWPGAYTYWTRDGETVILKIWRSILQDAPTNLRESEVHGTVLLASSKDGLWIQAGDRPLRITEIQLPGKKRMDAKILLRGHDLKGGLCRAES